MRTGDHAALRHIAQADRIFDVTRPDTALQIVLGGLPDLPELRLVGCLAGTEVSDYELTSHRHDSVEVVYVERGAPRFWVGSEWHDLTSGDIFVTWPGEPHGGGPRAFRGCRVHWLQIHTPAKRFLSLPETESNAILERLNNLPSRRFAAPTQLAYLFDGLRQLLDDPLGPLSVVQARALLLDFVLTILRAGAAPSAPSALVASTRELLERRIDAPLRLVEVARQVGCTVSTLKRRFSEEVGVPPAEYHLRQRVREGSRRLRETGDSVTEIAFSLGFSSSQYFATVIKRITGLTPSEVRATAGFVPQAEAAPLIRELPGRFAAPAT